MCARMACWFPWRIWRLRNEIPGRGDRHCLSPPLCLGPRPYRCWQNDAATLPGPPGPGGQGPPGRPALASIPSEKPPPAGGPLYLHGTCSVEDRLFQGIAAFLAAANLVKPSGKPAFSKWAPGPNPWSVIVDGDADGKAGHRCTPLPCRSCLTGSRRYPRPRFPISRNCGRG